MLAAIVRTGTGGVTIALVFYNSPTVPEDTFGSLLTIPTIAKDLGTRSFYGFVVAASQPYISTIPVRYAQFLWLLGGSS